MIPAHSNPFRSSRIEQLRYHFDNSDWDAFLSDLKHAGNRGAIVGPHGSGKTTFISELNQLILKRGESVLSVRLNSERRSLTSAEYSALRNHRGWVLLDGAEQLTFWKRLVFRWRTKQAAAVVVTAHSETWLPTVLRTTSKPETFCTLLTSLTGGTVHLLPHEAEALLAKHQGNMREVFRESFLRFNTLL